MGGHYRNIRATLEFGAHVHRRLTMQMICNPDTDFVWRIEENDDGSVECTYIGFCAIDSDRIKTYTSSQELPEWIKDRVAVLRMMPPDPNKSIVFGVGRRVSENVYWVVEQDRVWR